MKNKSNIIDPSMTKISKIRSVQLIADDMLQAFDAFCEAEGIKYSAAGGTLLGAVRYNGFIPWDDDIDLFLLRQDYEKLLKISKEKGLPSEYYQFVHMDAGAPGITWIRLVDKRTHVVHRTSSAMTNTWIDILPIDAVPDELAARKSFGRRMRKLRRKRLFCNAVPFSGKTKIRAILKTPVVFIINLFGAKKRTSQRISKEAQTYRNTNSEYACEIVAQGYVKGVTRIETFTSPVYLDFENHKIPAMPDWKEYLANRYGKSYMQIPAVRRQKSHKINVWVNLEQYDEKLRNSILEAENAEVIKDTTFFNAVESCKGNVYLVTSEGDRFNVKDKLCHLIGLVRIFQCGKIVNATLECEYEEDKLLFADYNIETKVTNHY